MTISELRQLNGGFILYRDIDRMVDGGCVPTHERPGQDTPTLAPGGTVFIPFHF